MRRVLKTMLALCVILTLLPLAAALCEDNEVHIISRNIGVTSDNDNLIFKEIEARTGLKIDWELKPSENYANQCQVIIASGKYPDAMEFHCTTYPNDLQTLAEDGVIMPLDDLLAEYGQEILAARPDYTWFTYDGKRYAIPCRLQEAKTNDPMLIRKDWLDKLGLQVPTNYDELKAVFQAFYDNSALLTGSDTVKIRHGSFSGGGWQSLQSGIFAVIASQDSFTRQWNVVDGDLVYFVNMPGYKDTLAKLRELYQAGLIEPEYALMNREQFLEKFYQNAYGSVDWYLDQIDAKLGTMIGQYYTNVPEAEFAAVYPFADKNGVQQMKGNIQQQMLIIFADTPKETAANVVKLSNFLMSEEGWYLTELGIEGKHWDFNADGSINAFTLTAQQKEEMGWWQYNWISKRLYINPATRADVKEMADRYSKIAVAPPIIATTPTFISNGAALNDMVLKYEAELIVSKDIDFDAVFDEYIKLWNEQGGLQWTAEMNDVYRQQAK